MKQRFVWTDEKLEELKKICDKESIYKISKYFHTTPKVIDEKIKELGLQKLEINYWTKEEEQLLIEYSKIYLTDEIAHKLNRSYLAVQKKAIKLGIKLHSTVDPWEEWMVDYLKENINRKSIREISKKIGISYYKILNKCNELGIEYRKEAWTEEEINILRENAQKYHYKELVKLLPNRSDKAIFSKAYELGIQTISEYHQLNEEYAKYIKENWGVITIAEIARNLKIGVGVVYRYKKELKLPNVYQKVTTKWTNKIIEKLREDAKTKTREELAKKYKTSMNQLSTIATKYDIKLINSRQIWNEELDKKLSELFKNDVSIDKISKELNIKTTSIRNRLKILGIYSTENEKIVKRWTTEEIDMLKELSKTKNLSEIAKQLNRTENSVFSKARRININIDSGKNNSWTKEEEKTLIKLSEEYDRATISKIMNRSEYLIKEKARELEIKLKMRKKEKWTTEEENLLRIYAKEYSIKEIAELLDRSINSVMSKLESMGIEAKTSDYFWTTEECEKLKELAADKTIDEISKIMNKNRSAISNKLNKMNIKAKKIFNGSWTTEEDLQLQELLTTYSSFEIGKILNRSEEAIINRAISLGYEINKTHRQWTNAEEELLTDLWGSKSIEYIAKKLNRTQSAIINRVYKLGLGSQINNNYDGISIQDISNLLGIERNTILTSWVILGLKLDFRKRSNQNVYSYVQISNLLEFLEANQNIWDSRKLEESILGKEPEWLKQKRENDRNKPENEFKRNGLLKQQLIQAKKYFLDMQNYLDDEENKKQGDITKLLKK